MRLPLLLLASLACPMFGQTVALRGWATGQRTEFSANLSTLSSRRSPLGIRGRRPPQAQPA